MSKTNSRITRRRFVAGAGAIGLGAATGVLAAPRIVRAEGKITVLNWQGYGTDEAWAVEAFKKATGIEVVHDYFNSEPEMITKLRTNPGAYDVVLTNSAWNGVASGEELIQAIDTAQIKHFADLNPSLRDSALLAKDGKVYGVSWVWGMTAIAYNTEKFNPAPDSVEVLWDPKNAKRVSVRDDAVEAVSYGAIATGQDMNHPKDIENPPVVHVGQEVKDFVPSVRKTSTLRPRYVRSMHRAHSRGVAVHVAWFKRLWDHVVGRRRSSIALFGLPRWGSYKVRHHLSETVSGRRAG